MSNAMTPEGVGCIRPIKDDMEQEPGAISDGASAFIEGWGGTR